MQIIDIRKFRKDKNLTQVELADALGVPQSRISKIEQLKQTLTPRQIASLIRKYGPLDGYYTSVENISELNETAVEYEGGQLLFIPHAAEAGFLSGEVSPITNSDLIPYQGIPTFNQPGYAFVVSGESMLDTLRPGEVIVTGRDPVKHISEIKSGYIYVIDTEDAILVKRVNRHSDDQMLWLESDNEDYDEIEISFEKIRHMWRARRIIGFNLNKKMRYE